ncbi:MAG: OsmC family protein [Acidobacteriia bacterium]|nr:OsmC family protein [Terriglobia bacterium]
MRITARVENGRNRHQVALATNDRMQSIPIPPKPDEFGSSVNGGELLFLALATCYRNDIYREGAKRGIAVERVEVEVTGDFETEGAAATNVTYRPRVMAKTSEESIRELMVHTDRVAEIHNTLRTATPVTLSRVEAVRVD